MNTGNHHGTEKATGHAAAHPPHRHPAHHRPYYYKLHGKSPNGEVTVHISRNEALKLIAGLANQLQRRQTRGHREFFLFHVKNGRMYNRLAVTHHNAHRRIANRRLQEQEEARRWLP
jgi:hypothetical protein